MTSLGRRWKRRMNHRRNKQLQRLLISTKCDVMQCSPWHELPRKKAKCSGFCSNQRFSRRFPMQN